MKLIENSDDNSSAVEFLSLKSFNFSKYTMTTNDKLIQSTLEKYKSSVVPKNSIICSNINTKNGFLKRYWIFGKLKNGTEIAIPSSYVVPVDREKFKSKRFLSYFPRLRDKETCNNDSYIFAQQEGNFCQIITYSWLTKIFWVVLFRRLIDQDIWSLGKIYKCDYLEQKFQRLMSLEKMKAGDKLEYKNNYNLHSQLYQLVQFDLFFAVVTSIIHGACCVLKVVYIDLLLSSLRSQEYLKSMLIATITFITVCIETVNFNYMQEKFNDIGVQIKSLLTSMVFQKILRMNDNDFDGISEGQHFNIISGDVTKFPEVLRFVYDIWLAPMEVIFFFIYLYFKIGIATVYGFSIIFLFIPINIAIGKMIKKLYESLMIVKDERLRLIKESLFGMKVLKLYNWIDPILQEIRNIRAIEMSRLKSARMYEALLLMIMKTSPIMICTAVFFTYISEGHTLTADVAFVIIMTFDGIFFPITQFPDMVNSLIRLNVSVNRIQSFLMLPESIRSDHINQIIPPEKSISTTLEHSTDTDVVLRISHLTYSWNEDVNVLQDINLTLRCGECIGICGSISSGKSSLLNAIIGNFKISKGTVDVVPDISYVPQNSWIMNCSVKDNILFGSDYDEEKYRSIIDTCCLKSDIDLFTDGDDTMIGDRGNNLSGGQKQRISIARALYSNSRLILLDDCLSAVDPKVGWNIFKNLTSKENALLSNRSMILITHNLKYLKELKTIYKMENGRLILTEKSTDEFDHALSHLCKTYSEKSDTSVENIIEGDAVDLERSQLSMSNQSFNESNEIQEVGDVGAYKSYLKVLRYHWFFFLIFSMALAGACNLSGRLLITKFISSATFAGFEMSSNQFLMTYCGLSLLQSLFVLVSSFLMAHSTYISSKRLHMSLCTSVFKSPMLYFEKHSAGDIMNYFSRDINMTDENIPNNLRSLLDFTWNIFFNLLGMIIIVPVSFLAMIPMMIAFLFLQHVYVRSVNQVQKLECESRNPLYSYFVECMEGKQLIRTFRRNAWCISKFRDFIENSVKFDYLIMYMSRWLALRVEICASFMNFLITIFCLYKSSIGEMDVADVGFIITYSTGTIIFMNWFIRYRGQLESEMVSFQRIYRNCSLPREETEEVMNKYITVPDDWIKAGEIEIQNFSTKYRSEQDLTLKQINLKIKPGEKIAVVGRTGAGKSSLIMSLFRMIHPVEGTISIDGVDILTVPIDVLRKNLTIIPQDLFLFSACTRKNLDPFHRMDDHELWNVLDVCQLKYLFSDDDLNTVIKEENLSAGEKQMMCLARALLKPNKIVILDEATANMDPETEKRIKNIVLSKFNQSTVITIAHRLDSILDYDRIIVLHQGQLMEFDSPKNLLENPRSMFFSMMQNVHKSSL